MKAKKLTLRDTDELIDYTESHPEVIHFQTYEMLNYLWKKDKKIDDSLLYQFEKQIQTLV